MDIQQYMQRLGEQARTASRAMARASSGDKDKALAAIASALRSHRSAVLQANQQDLDKGRESGLDAALLDRLELTPARFDAMVEGLEQIIALADPVGVITDLAYRPSGIQVGKMRVPLGVIGIIYESRPNVTIDAAASAQAAASHGYRPRPPAAGTPPWACPERSHRSSPAAQTASLTSASKAP